MRRSDSAVILFTLTPQAEGERKRLGLVRADRAVRVFSALIRHLKSVCRSLPGVDLLVSSPGEPRGLAQRGRDFGESLQLAVEDAFSLGYRRVLVIGNDAPEITKEYLEEAFEEISRGGARAVLGPAMDGGYNLLGLSAPCGEAFKGIPWGTRVVATLTESILLASGFLVSHLEALSDIDTAVELDQFLGRAIAGRSSMRRLAFRLKAFLAPASSERYLERFAPAARLDFRFARPLRAPPAAAR